MPKKRITTQMGDNPFRWEDKSQTSGEWVPYTEEDLEGLRKLMERKSKYKKKGRSNIERKYRFKK